MKRVVVLLALCGFFLFGYAQSPNYQADKAKIFETIKSRAFKLGYQYMITFDNVNDASFFVKPSKSYVVMYVYDISPRAATYFKAYLMTSDKEVQKKYTAKPYDVGLIGSARASRLDFTTPKFEGETRPIKVEAKPKATIYIFEK
jgi:hypothetical protein